ncbi:MAG: IS66 family transposase [Gammaproteobacteria bacterium]|nr:MAG: IS66 family transposase [Gammaproteobacteria bacterium]
MKKVLDTDLNPASPAALAPADLLQIIEEKDRLLAEQQAANAELQKLLRLMEEELRLARLRKFGTRSEKLPFQRELFDEAELEVSLEDVEKELAEEEARQKKPRKPRSKKPDGFNENLPRIQVHLTLDEDEKAGAGETFFAKVKEELDIVPAQVRVIEYWQEKAVFDQEDGTQRIVSAARPVHPLGKCLASTDLLAWVLTSKYADALPLYRLEGILKRHGGRVSRTTMANWVIRLDEVFQPLINLLRERQLACDYLQADETRLQVLKETGKSARSDKWMWVIRGGPPGQSVVLFEYDSSRSEEVPVRLLDGFTGVLQTDGYAGYNRVCRENDITRIGCWDHARRKFVEASRAAPKKKGQKVSKADVAISKIRKLYAIEQRIEQLPPEEKTRQRQQLATPVLEDLKSWLVENTLRVPKDSLTYKAMAYTLNQWALLTGYLADGQLRISNALAENAIRPFAIGRKNWLFADTPRGAKASATVYSLIETAKANGLEPLAYLQHVLRHIGGAQTLEQIEALLPWNVEPNRPVALE